MKTKYVIGIDFGTKSGRAVLVSCADGAILASGAMDYRHGVMDEVLPSGKKLGINWSLQHPCDYLEVLEATVKEVMRYPGIRKEDVIALSTDFTACTILPVDSALVPLCVKEEYRERPHAYVKLWKHHAAQKEADQINSCLCADQRISSEVMLPKILQIIHEDPEIYQKADQILEAPDWIAQLLTGERKRSGSTASYKAMWTPEGGYPDPVFLAGLNPQLEQLAREKLSGSVCSVGQKMGELTGEWAERLQLLPGIAVGVNIIDAHAGLVSCGVTMPGQMLLILGTSTAQTVISDHPYSGKGLLGNVKDQIVPGYYAIESGLASAGDSLEWFIRTLLPAGCVREAERFCGGDVYRLLNQKAAVLAPGECGLVALDWLNGNKTPYVDGDRTSAILGLSLNTKPEDIWRALMESAAFGTRLILDVMKEASIPVKEIRCCGGLAEKNPLLMQIFADVLQCELKVIHSTQTAAAGAAIYAAVAAGKEKGGYDTIAEAVKRMSLPISKTYLPDKEAGKIYDQLYALFLGMSKAYAPREGDPMKVLKALKESSHRV